MESDWIAVAPDGSLASGEHIVVDVNGTAVAVFRIGDDYYAIEDMCTHDYAEIAEGGILDGCEIICARHGARFCLKTGKVLKAPAYEDLAVFPVRIEQGVIQVRERD